MTRPGCAAEPRKAPAEGGDFTVVEDITVVDSETGGNAPCPAALDAGKGRGTSNSGPGSLSPTQETPHEAPVSTCSKSSMRLPNVSPKSCWAQKHFTFAHTLPFTFALEPFLLQNRTRPSHVREGTMALGSRAPPIPGTVPRTHEALLTHLQKCISHTARSQPDSAAPPACASWGTPGSGGLPAGVCALGWCVSRVCRGVCGRLLPGKQDSE